jgi:hypothetical protein
VNFNPSPAHTNSAAKAVQAPYPGAIPGKLGMLKAAYGRTQRLLNLSETKLTYLENNPDVLESMPIREFRTLSKSILDLQKELLNYANLIEEEENRPALQKALLDELLKESSPLGNHNTGVQQGQPNADKTVANNSVHQHSWKNDGNKR